MPHPASYRNRVNSLLLALCPVAQPLPHGFYWSSKFCGQCSSKPGCLASLMQSIIAHEMADAVETTSSGVGPRGCREVRSGGIGEVERSWHVSTRHRTPSVAPRGQGLMICVFPLQWHIVPAPQIKILPPPQHLAPTLPYCIRWAHSGSSSSFTR